jgi:predicted ATPase
MTSWCTMLSNDLYVLTGAPGSGKTTTLDNLDADIRRVGEPAREIIAEHRSRVGPNGDDPDPSLFVRLLLQRSIDKHEAAQGGEGAAVFDRGVPDCIAYATLRGIDPSPSVLASEVYRYHREVLVFEPWEEIYTFDDARTMSFADTIGFHEAIMQAYDRAGYVPVVVPRGSIDSRAAFVRDHITHR